MHEENGFALATVMILVLVFAAGLVGLYRYSSGFAKTSALYERTDYMETLNRSAAGAAGEFLEQVLLDKVDVSQYATVTDPDVLTNDLLPSASANWEDSADDNPDLVFEHDGGFQSRVDIDFIPLTAGFAWTSIKFAMAYHEEAAGNSVAGSQTYRIHTITTGPNGRRIESDAIYVVHQ